MITTRPIGLAGTLATLLLAACASTEIESQWADPQLAGTTTLRGAKVAVVCEAYDLDVKSACQEQVASELVARGATAVAGPDASARALLTVAISLAETRTSPGFSVGLGGFGIGGGSVRGGVGVSVPIGGGRIQSGYTASTRLTEMDSGRLLWTARATSAPSGAVNAQMAELAKAVLDAADKAGLF